MAVVKEVVAVCNSILDTVSKIENFKEDWFTVSLEYHTEAQILCSKLAYYEEKVRVHQQPVDSTMMKILEKAKFTLKRAKARLDKLEKNVNSDQCCSQLWWFYAKITLTLFPERLEKTFQMVIKELENIPKNIKEEVEVAGLMREAGKNRAISTIVHNNDDKYVPIEKSQSAVIKAIEDSDGPPMILLHGGVGKGKSTLARYICERYGQSREKSNVFDHVILVSCGSSSISDVATKQYEILEHLSPTSLTEESSSKSGTAKSGGSKSRITKALHDFFVGKKILMILDNVSDKGFLYKMWEAVRDGKDDKILVTSQRSNLCEDIKHHSVLITMGDPAEQEARKILASLVGLDSNIIPENIQKYADNMIKATDGNPLALACLASTFSHNPDKQNTRDWRDAWMELSQLLDHTDRSIVLGQSDETAPPRSLWGAMRLCIDSLDTSLDAKRTLFLMYACKGESVPEEVLRILCAGLKMSSSSFKRARDELWMRELLKRKANTLASNMISDEQQSPAWALQSLVKLYMERHAVGEQEVRDVIATLLGNDDFLPESSIQSKQHYETEILESDEMRVTIALCALYFDRRHTDKVVTRAVSKACKISSLVDSDDTINDLRRKAIGPLIWLLDKPEEDDEWTEMDKCRVRKVLLEYTCKCQLDNQNILYLLKLDTCPSAQLATLAAISHISSIEETALLNQNTITFVQAIIDLVNLKEGFHVSVQLAASKALRHVCWKASRDKSAALVASMPSVLDVFVHSLAIPVWKSEAFAENIAYALPALAGSDEMDSSQEIILNKLSILPGLVKRLYQQSNPCLQEAAAGALANLAASQDNALKLKVVHEEGAVVGLVNCLSAQDHPDVQTAAAWALANLAASQDNALKLKVAHEEGALVGLVNCLSAQDHRDLQTQAARALGNLAGSQDNALKLKVVHEEGALVGLVNCLSAQDHRDLQTKAARALGNLAAAQDNALKFKVVHEEGALVGLVNCLSAQDHRDLQTKAARALGNLAAAQDNALKFKVVHEEGALVGLVNCLSAQDHRDLQTKAARALGNLAAAQDNALKLKVVHEEGALVGLVNCLSAQDHRDLQTKAARALGNLAAAQDNALKFKVVHEEGALVGLVNCLSAQDHRDLQTKAARALGNLAAAQDNALKFKVANEDGALVSLVSCLSQRDDHELQREVARMASNLALDSNAMVLLQGTKGLLQGLTGLVGDEVDPDTRSQAIEALFKIDPALAKEVGLYFAELPEI